MDTVNTVDSVAPSARALLTYGVCGLAVLHHVQAPDLVGGVHAELADGLHRDQGVAA